MKYEGYFPKEELPIKPGDKVIIPMGIKIKSLHPKKKEYVSRRKQTIEVNHILSGVTTGNLPKSNPKVCWAGSGGYWCEVDINDLPL